LNGKHVLVIKIYRIDLKDFIIWGHNKLLWCQFIKEPRASEGHKVAVADRGQEIADRGVMKKRQFSRHFFFFGRGRHN
jgi:hypothetical protein